MRRRTPSNPRNTDALVLFVQTFFGADGAIRIFGHSGGFGVQPKYALRNDPKQTESLDGGSVRG